MGAVSLPGLAGILAGKNVGTPNQEALLTPSEQQQLANLHAQLSVVQGAEFDAVERAYCELSWSTDIADRSRARELARQLFVDGLHINFQVNRALGKDGEHFAQQPTMVEQVAALQIPTLVIHGALDPRPARVARHLAQCMPSARYVELPNVGHLPWIEQPDLLRGVLRPFLERFSVNLRTMSENGRTPVKPYSETRW